MGEQRTSKRIKKVKGFNVKPLPIFRVRALSRKLRMIDFVNPNEKWPFTLGRGFTAEDKVPISDAKIAADKAVSADIKMTNQMCKMQIMRDKNAMISNKVDILPKLDAKEVPISIDQQIANKLPKNARKSTEIKMPISDAKIAADKAVINQYIKKTDPVQKMPIMGAKSSKFSNRVDILPKSDAKELNISNDQKITNKHKQYAKIGSKNCHQEEERFFWQELKRGKKKTTNYEESMKLIKF
ncbi:hypothetical protein niasHT_001076 [Heterodera trifolii]|uniref:Uncharacterized protein n=1 Tax=Heterodera trifolii TaxID=157864 RepID=A0ABD2MC34_9BILA